MTQIQKIFSACLVAFSSFSFADSACTNNHGDYTCLIYNYSEKAMVASYPKVDPKDKSAEQRAASFPARLNLDNGGKYKLISTSSTDFKPFTVIYSNNGNGCSFTFSPAIADDKLAFAGYSVSSKAVGSYSEDSCQHDGAALTIKDN